jgi:FlaA1/EpsC-like NDP-sugar epimerase
MKRDIILFPFGGNAREALLSIQAINDTELVLNVLGFVDDNNETWGKSCCGVPVLGGSEVLAKYKDSSVVAGNPARVLRKVGEKP